MAGAGFDPAAALEELEGTLASAREHVKRGRLEVPIDPPTKWALEALANMANSVEAARRLIVEIVHRTMCACERPGLAPVALDCPVHGRPLQVREIDPEEAAAQMRHADGRGRMACQEAISKARREGVPISLIVPPDPPHELVEMGLSKTWFQGFADQLAHALETLGDDEEEQVWAPPAEAPKFEETLGRLYEELGLETPDSRLDDPGWLWMIAQLALARAEMLGLARQRRREGHSEPPPPTEEVKLPDTADLEELARVLGFDPGNPVLGDPVWMRKLAVLAARRADLLEGIGSRASRVTLTRGELRDLVFTAAGAATRPLMIDHPGYRFPEDRVIEAIEDVLEGSGYGLDRVVSRETPEPADLGEDETKRMEWAEQGRSDASEAIARCRAAGERIETLVPAIDKTVGEKAHHRAYERAFTERAKQEIVADLSTRLREIAAGQARGALRPVRRGPDRVWAIDDPPEFLIEAFDLAVGAKVEKELIDLRRAFSVWLLEMNRAFTTVATAVSERAAGNRLGDGAHQALGALSVLLRLETGHVEADEDEIAAATVTVRKSLMPGGRE